MINFLKGLIEFVMEILETIAFVGSLFIVVYLFILSPNQVKGVSMEPTFQSGEYILTSKITYKFKKLERGDVVIFKSPKNPDIEYIKRIIGLPGDIVKITDSGQVYVNDVLISESYILATTNLWPNGCVVENRPYQVPKDSIFVMGDNRPRSADSREFCAVPIQNLIGYVFYRYYPPPKMGLISNPWPKSLR